MFELSDPVYYMIAGLGMVLFGGVIFWCLYKPEAPDKTPKDGT